MSTKTQLASKSSDQGNGIAILIPVCLSVIVAAFYYIYTLMQTYFADVDAYADHDVMVRFQSNIGMAVIAATLSALLIMTVTTGSQHKA
jgi:uncharacterized membrane protein YqhA